MVLLVELVGVQRHALVVVPVAHRAGDVEHVGQLLEGAHLVVAAFALVALAVAALSLWRGGVAGALRALGLALILIALADPSLMREERQPLKDIVAVVVDRSASQSIGAPRRFNCATL